jgi:hypothetical protein
MFRDLVRIAIREDACLRSSTIQHRQGQYFEIEPGDPFGVVGIEPMSFYAVLAEFAKPSVQFAFAETGHRRTQSQSGLPQRHAFWSAQAVCDEP